MIKGKAKEAIQTGYEAALKRAQRGLQEGRCALNVVLLGAHTTRFWFYDEDHFYHLNCGSVFDVDTQEPIEEGRSITADIPSAWRIAGQFRNVLDPEIVEALYLILLRDGVRVLK